MADIIDNSSDYEQLMLQKAIDNRVQFIGESNFECDECGNEIPAPRRALGGVKFCVACQQVIELKKAHYR